MKPAPDTAGRPRAPIAFLNGEFLPETTACVPLTDRGWLFGDAVFETLRTHRGEPLFWGEHLARFHRGAQALQIRIPCADQQLARALRTLVEENQVPDAAVRLTLSRGSGPRGYSPRGADHPTLALTTRPAPPLFGGFPPPAGWNVITSRHRLPPADDLSQIKHANRLLAILARAEADAAGADEALLLDTAGHLAEASGANLFWFEPDGTIVTPDPKNGALPGLTQAAIGRLLNELGWPQKTGLMPPGRLRNSAGGFLTNSLHLLVPLRSVDGHPLPQPPQIAILQAEIRSHWLADTRDPHNFPHFPPSKG